MSFISMEKYREVGFLKAPRLAIGTPWIIFVTAISTFVLLDEEIQKLKEVF